MPDDFVVNVRQISQYPFRAAAAATDAILLQTGGLGGPYAYTDPMGLLAPLAQGGPLGVGTQPPFDAFPAQTFTGWSVLEAGGSLAFNAYADANGQSRYLIGGPPAGIVSMDAVTGFSFGWATGGAADAPVEWNTIFNIHPDGTEWIARSVTVNGDLIVGGHATVMGDEVATIPWVKDFVVDFAFTRNVRSWNGQRGDVRFTILDLIAMGGAPQINPRFQGRATLNGDPLATENYALAAIDGIFTLDHMICLGLAPLHSPPFQGKPTAPTPPIANSSDRLATTRFVHQFAARRIDNAVNDAVDLATAGLDATIAEIVDEAIQGVISQGAYLPLTGGTLTGYLGAPAVYVDTELHAQSLFVRGINQSQSPPFGPIHVWTSLECKTTSATVILSRAPASAMEAANKGYVDSAVGAGGNFLPLTGGKLTGNLQVGPVISAWSSETTVSPDGIDCYQVPDYVIPRPPMLNLRRDYSYQEREAPIIDIQNQSVADILVSDSSGYLRSTYKTRISYQGVFEGHGLSLGPPPYYFNPPEGEQVFIRVHDGTNDIFRVGTELYGYVTVDFAGTLYTKSDDWSWGQFAPGRLSLENAPDTGALISLEHWDDNTPAITLFNGTDSDHFRGVRWAIEGGDYKEFVARITSRGQFVGRHVIPAVAHHPGAPEEGEIFVDTATSVPAIRVFVGGAWLFVDLNSEGTP